MKARGGSLHVGQKDWASSEGGDGGTTPLTLKCCRRECLGNQRLHVGPRVFCGWGRAITSQAQRVIAGKRGAGAPFLLSPRPHGVGVRECIYSLSGVKASFYKMAKAISK